MVVNNILFQFVTNVINRAEYYIFRHKQIFKKIMKVYDIPSKYSFKKSFVFRS